MMLFLRCAVFLGLVGCTVSVEPQVTVKQVDVALCIEVSQNGKITLVECDAGESVNPFGDAAASK